jgi:predicted dehydrogenase/threonine dehydrogenase-like Zn-dependent dehydrogenase
MKQVLQNMATGETMLVDAPAPKVGRGQVLVETRVSLISAGTERMLVDFGNASLLAKARQQPEKVKMVLDKVRTDGLAATIGAVRSKLEQPIPLGYCNVGVVRETGDGQTGLAPGDRVVSNGPHADVVVVPKNLCAKIPDGVTDEQAAFTVLAAIGLQGIRLAQPTLGESFVVTGAGLIGLLAIQLLRAHGCRVMAIDYDEAKLAIARKYGAQTCNPAAGEDPVAAGLAFSRGHGVDGVIIAASTSSSDPVAEAARMCRKRGRIVLVGVTGLALNRSDFYEKELIFQVSCSYGPGRYDAGYEAKGNDYPRAFVRWTEQRNFEAVLDMMVDGRIDVRPLISHRFGFESAPEAYRLLTEVKGALGIFLEYASPFEERTRRRVALEPARFNPAAPRLAFLGAGNYASRVLIPAFKRAGAQLHTLVTAGGSSAVVHGRKAGFSEASTDLEGVLADPAIDSVVIATRHDTHSRFASMALDAGKHVFVEKPLAIDVDGVSAVEEAYRRAQAGGRSLHLMVGFNRRFSPHVQRMQTLLAHVSEPKAFIMTMNAGYIPESHWTQDLESGGGRIVGEACHFVDLMRFLVGSSIVSVQARRMGGNSSASMEDRASITLGFADGSFGTILYLSNGAADFPKERIEAFASGRVLQLDNFRTLRGFGWPGFKTMRLWKQDKGQQACAAAFLTAVATGQASPIPPNEIFEVARATLEAAQALRTQP